MAWVIRSAYDKFPQAFLRELFFCLGEPQEGKSVAAELLLAVLLSSLTWGREKVDEGFCTGKLSAISGLLCSFSCCSC